MKSISKGLEEVEKELDASEDDGPISEVFHWVQILEHLVPHAKIVSGCPIFMLLFGRR